jgi:hypothetical protein
MVKVMKTTVMSMVTKKKVMMSMKEREFSQILNLIK